MLNIKYIRANIEEVRKSIEARRIVLDIDELVELDDRRKAITLEIENARARANQIARHISQRKGVDNQALIDEGRTLKATEAESELKLAGINDEFNRLMLQVPNVLAPDTPIGENDTENVVVRTFGEPTKFNFPAQDHLSIGQRLGIVDFESGAKVTGNKFYFLQDEGADLEMALQSFVIAKAKKAGFSFLRTPDLAKAKILQGSGFSPKGENSNIYNIDETDLSLIATSEITIGGMLSDRVYEKESLPVRYVGLSHCFRREAGASGQSSKGLYRVHQFSKVELYVLADPARSEEHLQEILALEESIYQDLGLPYQVVRICSGDLGTPAYKKYDIEVWMPGKGERGEFGEVTSAGNFTDFQSRRLNIKYVDENKAQGYAHTLNGTAVATTRVMLAILENYQREDGGVAIPEVLKPYMGIDEIKPKEQTPIFRALKPR